MKNFIKSYWLVYFLTFYSFACFSIEIGDLESDLKFTENKGQFDNNVVYRAMLINGAVFLENNEITYKFKDAEKYHQIIQSYHNRQNIIDPILQEHAYKVKFINSNPSNITSKSRIPSYENFFLGNKQEKWAKKVYSYSEITYQNIYDNIDLRIYGKNKNLKKDWVIHPNGEIRNIKLKYEGVNQLVVHKNVLEIFTSVGIIREEGLMAYQYLDGEKVEIDIRFQLINHNTIAFDVSEYNKNLPLYIDPVLIFSTYSGSEGDNFGFTATYDSEENLYAGGITDGNDGKYPVTTGAFQTNYGGSTGGSAPINLPCDITISKYNKDGTSLLYATYIGGSANEHPHSLVVDNNDNLLVLGTTFSNNFPISVAFDSSFNGSSDIVVFKLKKDGSELLASTYMGGSGSDGLASNNSFIRYNYADDFRGEIITDKDDNVYVASSSASSNFPVKNAFNKDYLGNSDGVIFAIKEDFSDLLWSTYFGGDRQDACYSLKFNRSEDLYISGGTRSNNIPIVGSSNQQIFGGVTDGFLLKINKTNGQVTNSTYFGGDKYDQAYFVEVDLAGAVYIAGQTQSSLTRTSATYGQDNKGQFVAQFNQDLSQLNWLTTFGNRNNRPDISPSAFLVDNCYNIYLSGWGSDAGDINPGSTQNLPITNDAIQSTTDNNDFYLICLSKNAKSLIYASYFGGNQSSDHVDGGTSRFDKRGVIYQSVCSSCSDRKNLSDFPVTSNAVFTKNKSQRCSNASFKIDFQISKPVVADFIANPTKGCVPLTVQFENKSINGKTYFWNFGDGGTSAQENTKHTYIDTGVYVITLKIKDSTTCNVIDSFSREVRVYNYSIADFDAEPIRCTRKVDLKAKSINSNTFLWKFENGITLEGEETSVTFDKDGQHNITLITENNTGCVDSITKTVMVLYKDTLKPDFVFNPNPICVEGDAQFTYTGFLGENFKWYIRDSLFSTSKSSSFFFDSLADYPVKLIVTDTNACLIKDSIIKFVPVIGSSKALFAVMADPCKPEVVITDKSFKGFNYFWDMGNDSIIRTVGGFSYIYNKPGLYEITLRLNPGNNCSDSFSTKVQVEDKDSILLDVFADPLSGCMPLEVNFTDNSKKLSTTTFTWNYGDNTSDQSLNPTHLYDKAGDYLATYTLQDPNACNTFEEKSFLIRVREVPLADFQYDLEFCSSKIEFTNLSNDIANQFYWDFGNGDTSLLKYPEYGYSTSGVKTVTLITNKDSICSDTVKANIPVNIYTKDSIKLYNVFTPNNDGMNDCFSFRGVDLGCENLEFYVYNRWGELIYENLSFNNCWEGKNKDNNKMHPQGVYYYILVRKNIENEKDIVSGTITIFE